ncbi:MAG: hypothetical protein AB7S57_24775 [Acetobacteraceae bacterium]
MAILERPQSALGQLSRDAVDGPGIQTAFLQHTLRAPDLIGIRQHDTRPLDLRRALHRRIGWSGAGGRGIPRGLGRLG